MRMSQTTGVATVRVVTLFAAVFCAVSAYAHAQDQYLSPKGHLESQVMRQTLGKVFVSAKQKDIDGFLATAAERYIQHSPDLPDGWKPVWDLLNNRPEGFSSKQMKWLGPSGFLDNGRYLIMLREVNRGDRTPPSKIVDVMRFDSDGKYAEHWDVRQALSQKTASGRSETGAADVFVNNPVNYSVETEEANKKTVAAFLELAFNQRKLGGALDKYVAKGYVQHSPLIPDGVAPLKAMLEGGKVPWLNFDIQLIAAHNDLVVVFAKVKVVDNSKEMAVVDIHRVRDGKLVEHWDVLQSVPTAAEMPHTNGMFIRSTATAENQAAVGAIELISYKPKQGVTLDDAFAMDLRVKDEYVVKQPGFISRHTGVTKDGTVFVQVLWDSLASVEASQSKGMKNELMGQYMRVMDQPSIKFHNIDIKQ